MYVGSIRRGSTEDTCLGMCISSADRKFVIPSWWESITREDDVESSPTSIMLEQREGLLRGETRGRVAQFPRSVAGC